MAFEKAVNNRASKGRTVLFWIVTGLLSFELLFGALWDFNLIEKGYVYGVLQHLGYPLYLASLLGTCKILAGVIILIPHFGLIKEWAYAGIVILFGGGLFSHISTDDGPDKYGMAVAFLIITIISWSMRTRRSDS
jgi:hypothetical protein